MITFTFHEINYLDIAQKIFSISLSVINLLIVIYIYRQNTKINQDQNSKERKLSLLKTLILDYNLKYFYETIGNIENKLTKLQVSSLSDPDKSKIVAEVNNEFISLRRNFTDTLLAINNDLYNNILGKTDELQGLISTAAFDDGINLANKPMYDSKITSPISETKTNILKALFNYTGE